MTSAGGAAERERAPERADGLAGAIVLEERLAEAAEELRGGHALLRVLDADAEDLFGLLDLAEVDARASRAGPRPLAMSARASGASICPSGVRRKMASGAGQLPRSCDDLRPLLAERGGLGLGDLREVDRAARAGRDAIELLADERADAEAEGVELVRLLDAVVQDDELGAAAPARRATSLRSE